MQSVKWTMYLTLSCDWRFVVREWVSCFIDDCHSICYREELRRRFVKAESMLFRIRWDGDDSTERGQFVKSLGLGLNEVPQEELASLEKELIAATGVRKKEAEQQLVSYFKVHWTRVTELVATRRVLLKGGYAYVPIREQSSIVFQEFSTRLERALEVRTPSTRI